MKYNTYIQKIFLCLSISVLLFSCKKQLEEVIPQTSISKNLALTDAGAAQTIYEGIYSRLRAQNSLMFYLGEMRSQLWVDGLFTESVDGTAQMFYTHTVSYLTVPYGEWGGLYNLIYNINNVIEVLPQSPLDAATVKKDIAEMYGLRAYVYYLLLKTWGEVPLATETIDKIDNAAQTYKARSSKDSVMALIKSDIAKSLDMFGSDNTIESGKRVYWNRVATLVLKGDVYLWSATNLGGGTADLNTAKAALQEVKNLEGSTLGLDANYADIFDPTKKENNKEIIFALNYEISQAVQTTFTNFRVNALQATGMSFSPTGSPTVSEVYPYASGANRVGLSLSMINNLTSGPADQRIANSFKVMYSTAASHSIMGVMLTKFIGVTSGTTQVYNNDYPIYRYADVLLLLAEAKTKLGESPASEINEIRQRAYGTNAPVFTNGSVKQNMDAILEEYLREFIGEGKLWWALRRAGDSYVYDHLNPTYFSPASTEKMLLPITQTMLNNDPLLKQTEGYPTIQ